MLLSILNICSKEELEEEKVQVPEAVEGGKNQSC